MFSNRDDARVEGEEEKKSKICNLFRWERREVSDRRELEVPAHAFLFPSGIQPEVDREKIFSHSRAAIMRH